MLLWYFASRERKRQQYHFKGKLRTVRENGLSVSSEDLSSLYSKLPLRMQMLEVVFVSFAMVVFEICRGSPLLPLHSPFFP